MAAQIYGQAALDRLASPERLDAPLTRVGTPHWIECDGAGCWPLFRLKKS